MLNEDSLAQLEGLKSKMESEKEWAQGVVKGTQARYGFVVLEDGREIFIPPNEMLKVFPSDQVSVCIKPGRDNRIFAEVEKLMHCSISEFNGQCVSKGNTLFVNPDLPQIARWLFVHPKSRKGAIEGNYVRCKLLKHPIKDGRPQVEVLNILGDKKTPNIENLYCIQKYNLASTWSSKCIREYNTLIESCQISGRSLRKDLTNKDFISIDAARTQDIDDALFAEVSAKGWNLYVAIADPVSVIDLGSSLHQEISERATSIYFHGDLIPMMPESLVKEACALEENLDRPALVCQMDVGENGRIDRYEFYEAIVRSRAKLSYYSVEKYINGEGDDLLNHATPIEPLYQLSRALRAWREQNELVMEDKKEFRWILNDKKQIESIEPNEKLISQKLVEECMVATNRSAADFLRKNKANGPFVNHAGFRKDRYEEVKRFLEIHCSNLTEKDWESLSGYKDIITELSSENQVLPLRSMINRLLARARLSTTADIHMGMNIETYANCTSPLRKYVDFLAHVQIKAILRGKVADFVSAKNLDDIEEKIRNVRSATSEAEQWLVANYLEKLQASGVKRFDGTITHINSSGFKVRLVSNGLEGFIDLRQDPEKFSFDKWAARLSSPTRRFQLEQQVTVDFEKIDERNGHSATFVLVEGCGKVAPD